MRLPQSVMGRVIYLSLLDLVREYAYAIRWDHDDLDDFTSAVIEHAPQRTGATHRREAETTARKCARWTWEHLTELR